MTSDRFAAGAGGDAGAPAQRAAGAAPSTPRPPAAAHFGDRLAAAVDARQSNVVLGLDPDPTKLWPEAENLARVFGIGRDAEAVALLDAEEADADRAMAAGSAALAVREHCRRLIEAAGPACVAVKPQLACFERLGGAGWTALAETVAAARAAGLLVLLDGKRGDVPVTTRAYAQALAGSTPTPFGDVEGLRGDAFTANPLLGADALEPLVASGAGVFVLVRTSNPGAADLMDLRLEDGRPFWERLAELVARLGTPGPASGLADVGAVTGATVPEHLARMRELMPHAPFLLPGIGAQGGDVRELGPAFAPGHAAGLVTASRSIASAHEQHGGSPADAARAEAERLRELAWSLT